MNNNLIQYLCSHTGVNLRNDETITKADIDAITRAAGNNTNLLSCYLKRRISGEPLAYILGEIELDGLIIPIDKRAYITDPEAIYLIDIVKSYLSPLKEMRVLEVGTGCGSLSFCIERAAPQHQYTALDIDNNAINLALSSAKKLNSSVQFLESDYFLGLDNSYSPDVIFSDPPWGDETSIYEQDRPASYYNAMPGISVWPFNSITGIHEQIISSIIQREWRCTLFLNFGMLSMTTISNVLAPVTQKEIYHPTKNVTVAKLIF